MMLQLKMKVKTLKLEQILGIKFITEFFGVGVLQLTSDCLYKAD